MSELQPTVPEINFQATGHILVLGLWQTLDYLDCKCNIITNCDLMDKFCCARQQFSQLHLHPSPYYSPDMDLHLYCSLIAHSQLYKKSVQCNPIVIWAFGLLRVLRW